MSSPVDNPSAERKSARFAEHQQEIPSEQSLHDIEAVSGPADHKWEDLSPEAQAELQQLRSTLQNTVNIQQSRMQHHAFEALSLPGSQPASRVPSGTNTPQRKLIPTASSDASPRPSPPTSAIHSPPLTPAASKSQQATKPTQSGAAARPPDVMTPQRSTSPQHDSAAPVSSHPKQQPAFSVGPNNDSQPASKDASPAGTPGSTAPGTPRAYTPSIDESNKNKRPSRQADTGDARYRFGNRDPAVGYTTSGSGIDLNAMPVLPRTTSSSSVTKSEDKRSGLFGHHSKKHDEGSGSGQEKGSHHHHSSSKSNLKRFFKFGEHKHKEKDKESIKTTTTTGSKDGTKTPPTGRSESQSIPSVPFADDHGLVSKYGKFGKVLGSGAGGSVRLMKRSGDGVVFAVKQFRDRHAYESEREYNKKVTAEFCIGSTLHHGNIIETIDIVHEKGKWYEVMEYAPFDLFATVMTGKMGREEITCATLQILSGVLYLHSMGLAHRDLKLDNVVISEHGIMKLIDFGSAVVFRYPFENEVVLATGVVGSDPYLAPEVYDHAKYDPRMADIWSIAIIFCCMTLRRFPWKAPRISDNSYRLFVSPPDPDQDKLLDAHRRQQSSTRNSVASTPASRAPSANDDHHQEDGAKKSNNESISRQTTASNPDAQPTIKGPSRLLRLLPRETRHIIGRMLELDPRKRAVMDEILADPWVQNSLVCRQEENGVVIRAPNHTHTLSPSGGGGN